MAPSDERKAGEGRSTMESPTCSRPMVAVAAPPPSKTVAFAVNYELAMVDQFLCCDEKRSRSVATAARRLSAVVETPTSPTSTRDLRSISWDASGSAATTNIAPPPLIHATVNDTDTKASPPPPPQEPRLDGHLGQCDAVKPLERIEAPPESVSVNSTSKDLASNVDPSVNNVHTPTVPTATTTTAALANFSLMSSISSNSLTRRVSTRDKHKREAPLARNRVRYDMQSVPAVRRNRAFLDTFDMWWLQEATPSMATPATAATAETAGTTTDSASKEVSQCDESSSTGDVDVNVVQPLPFEEDSSVLWIPTKRSEWEDSVSEMTAVCTSAAIRRLRRSSEAESSSTTLPTVSEAAASNDDGPAVVQAAFQPPLSSSYIRDRIDIDDPLLGYQIRHKYGGWLQGFITFTHFTTWTYDFHWDSTHPLCGIVPPSDHGEKDTTTGSISSDLESPLLPNASTQRRVDSDGSLARELEGLSRSGDPAAGGIVFADIAEIALLGGLGCGEYLLRMALDDIRANTVHPYKYVALEAAVAAVPFYERFGFVRVGAVCQYGKPNVSALPLLPLAGDATSAAAAAAAVEPTVVGYRHWTHANESERSLQMRGPSYMMCLKLPERNAVDANSSGSIPNSSTFVSQMLKLRVESKPRVEYLGAAATPGLKIAARRSNSMPTNLSFHGDGSSSSGNSSPRDVRKQPSATATRRKSMVVSPTPPLSVMSPARQVASKLAASTTINASTATVPTATTASSTTNRGVKSPRVAKRTLASMDDVPPTSEQSARKRPKTAAAPVARGPLSSSTRPSRAIKPMTFAEKQYHSVWLAVPPKSIPSLQPPLPSRSSSKTQTVHSKSRRGRKPKNLIVPGQKSPASVAKLTTKGATDVAKSPNKYQKQAETGRIYHCIRGPDGKFKRVYFDEQAAPTTPISSAKMPIVPKRPTTAVANKQSGAKRKLSVAEPLVNDTKKKRLFDDTITSTSTSTAVVTDKPPSRGIPLSVIQAAGNPMPIDKKTFRKQKVKSYPRNQVHYYNRIVKPKQTTTHEDNLYYVFEYDEDQALLRLIPMIASGTLIGHRQGRPRYQCAIGDTDENFKTVAAADYEIVRSAVVMKTPMIAAEAWDVETDQDVTFSTR